MICTSCGLDVSEEDFVVGANVKGKQYKYCRACVKKYRDTHNRNNPLYQKEWYQERKRRGHYSARRLNNFGLTQEEYDRLFDFQGNKCAICGTTDPGPRDWSIDHDHFLGDTRGILCKDCNTGLGHFKDREDNLQAAIQYLRKPPLWLMRHEENPLD